MAVLHEGGLDVLLSVPAEKSFGGQAIVTGVIIRHILEDEYTLQSVMQNEIKVKLILNILMLDIPQKPHTSQVFVSNTESKDGRKVDFSI
jgi:hypothetical protein